MCVCVCVSACVHVRVCVLALAHISVCVPHLQHALALCILCVSMHEGMSGHDNCVVLVCVLYWADSGTVS